MSNIYDIQEEEYEEEQQEQYSNYKFNDDNYREHESLNYYELEINFSLIEQQNKTIKEENEKLRNVSFLLKESQVLLLEENKKLKESIKLLEEKLKICELEKDDIFERMNNFSENFEEESKKVKSLKHKLSKKEQEILIFQKQNEELKTINANLEKYVERLLENDEEKLKTNVTDKNSIRSCYDYVNKSMNFTSNKLFNENNHDSLLNNYSGKITSSPKDIVKNEFNSISTVYSSSNPKVVEKLNDFENCLSNLCPELELSDEENDKQTKFNIKLTPIDIVRRFSLKDGNTNRLNLAEQYFTEKPLKEKLIENVTEETGNPRICKKSPNDKLEDIYKEFFMLTYQAVVMNSNDLENIQKSYNEKEILYRKILANNIPFHKFADEITKDLNLKKSKTGVVLKTLKNLFK